MLAACALREAGTAQASIAVFDGCAAGRVTSHNLRASRRLIRDLDARVISEPPYRWSNYVRRPCALRGHFEGKSKDRSPHLRPRYRERSRPRCRTAKRLARSIRGDWKPIAVEADVKQTRRMIAISAVLVGSSCVLAAMAWAHAPALVAAAIGFAAAAAYWRAARDAFLPRPESPLP